jgi:DNA-binding NarL/FixJ family response regulator
MIHILVAGDIRLYRDGLALHLARQSGVSAVDCVASRAELLELLPTIRPDVLLLDMAMPESLRTLRDVADMMLGIRVVALAVPEVELAVLACAEAGIAGYVTRDASLDDLLNAIENAARGECVVSPRIAGSLLRRLSTLASTQGGRFDSESALTSRELEIAHLVDQGMSNKSIAGRLCIEVATVKNHMHNILAKLHAERRTEIPKRLRAAHSTLGQTGLERR